MGFLKNLIDHFWKNTWCIVFSMLKICGYLSTSGNFLTKNKHVHKQVFCFIKLVFFFFFKNLNITLINKLLSHQIMTKRVTFSEIYLFKIISLHKLFESKLLPCPSNQNKYFLRPFHRKAKGHSILEHGSSSFKIESYLVRLVESPNKQHMRLWDYHHPFSSSFFVQGFNNLFGSFFPPSIFYTYSKLIKKIAKRWFWKLKRGLLMNWMQREKSQLTQNTIYFLSKNTAKHWVKHPYFLLKKVKLWPKLEMVETGFLKKGLTSLGKM